MRGENTQEAKEMGATVFSATQLKPHDDILAVVRLTVAMTIEDQDQEKKQENATRHCERDGRT